MSLVKLFFFYVDVSASHTTLSSHHLVHSTLWFTVCCNLVAIPPQTRSVAESRRYINLCNNVYCTNIFSVVLKNNVQCMRLDQISKWMVVDKSRYWFQWNNLNYCREFQGDCASMVTVVTHIQTCVSVCVYASTFSSLKVHRCQGIIFPLTHMPCHSPLSLYLSLFLSTSFILVVISAFSTHQHTLCIYKSDKLLGSVMSYTRKN